MLIGPSGVQKKMINKSDDQEEAGRSHLSIMSMITDRIAQRKVLLPTDHNNFLKKKKILG